MTSYWDLEPCDYFDVREEDAGIAYVWSESLKAVGWLGSQQDFPTAPIAPEVFDALTSLTARAWQPTGYLGSHYCGLCVQAAGGYLQDFFALGMNADTSRRGTRNVFIPGEHVIYVAPELILHYISAHRYQPPEEFCAAVVSCPPMNGVAYFRALRRNATGDFVRIIPRARWWRFWNRPPTVRSV